jgi:hypothetical protein
MTTPINERPFFCGPANFTEPVTVMPIKYETEPLTSLTLRWGALNGSIRIPFKNMQALIIEMAERMYDEGCMDMSTAERLQYLSNVVLMDAREYAEVVAMEAGEDF